MSRDRKPPAHPQDGEPVALPITVGSISPRLRLHERSETISNFIRLYRVWQRPMTMFIVNYLSAGDVFVDVGANIGYFSVHAGLRIGSKGRVHAVEPDPENAALLTTNTALNGLTNVRLHRTAVSDYDGEATLFRGDFNAGAHSLLQKNDLTAGPQVPVATLDRLLANEPMIKLIKIDVQGAEMAVLRGLGTLLAKHKTKPAILVEFSPIELDRSGQLDAFFAFIALNNYSLRAFIVNERSTTKPPQLRRATLRQITGDLIEAKDPAEFDLLLLPNQ